LAAATAHGQTCDPAPLAGCRQPVAADKAVLLLKNKGGDGDKLVWKWIKGETTALEDFGNPLETTAYTLCIYDETGGLPSLQLTAFIPAGGDCDGEPCWSVIGKGFKYKDPTASNDGINAVLLKSGDAGKAKIIAKGKDGNLDTPGLPLAQDQEVIVQLKNQAGVCWEARYSPPAKKNEDGQFKDKGDAPVATATPGATSTGMVTATATITNTPGAASTATATFTVTATPTAGGGGVCGNRVIEPGETCASCAADCVIGPCSPVAPTIAFAVDLVPPIGEAPTSATVLLGYNSTRLSIPGTGSALSVRQRVLPPAPLPQAFAVNDLDYAVRVVISRNVALGHLFTATFDRCNGQPAPTLANLACTVEGCASGGTPLEGCACSVRVP
jgi:hypothetical protein